MRKFFIGFVPALLAIPSLAHAAPPEWQISEATGEVRLTHNGQSRAAVRGALLASGATIATGRNGRAVIVRGEEFVIVSPRTQLRVPASDQPNKVMQIIEDFGTAVFKIAKKATPHFGVQTPYLAAVVKGTTFTVTVGPEGSSVQVTEGAVEVATLDGGAVDLVEPGEIASVGASDLYRLTIDEGDSSKVVQSEQAAPAGTVTTNAPAAPIAAYEGPRIQPAEINEPIGENPQSLGDATDGLIEGNAAIDVAMVQVIEHPRGGDDAVRPDEAGGNPGSGSPGNGEGKAPDEPQGNPGGAATGGDSGDAGRPEDPGQQPGNGADPNETPGDDDGGAKPDTGGGQPTDGEVDPGDSGGKPDVLPEPKPRDDDVGTPVPGSGGTGGGTGVPEDLPGNGTGGGTGVPDDLPGNGTGDGTGVPDDLPGNGTDGGTGVPVDLPDNGNGGGTGASDNPPVSGGGTGAPDDLPGNGTGGNDDEDSSGPGSGGGSDDDNDDNSGPGGGGGSDDDDDNSGPGSGGGGSDDDDDNSGPGNANDHDDDDRGLCLLGRLCVDLDDDDG
jgi:collagen type III alpha